MKKTTVYLAVFCMLLIAAPKMAKASVDSNYVSKDAKNTVVSMDSMALMNRLNEIYAMNTDDMTMVEKMETRKEVLEIKKQLNDNGGIYISVGVLLLVIILLIVLL